MRVPNNVPVPGNATRNPQPQIPSYRLPPPPPPIRPFYNQSKTLPGFYIDSEEDIGAGDVLRDGSISFFPYKDLSKIVLRQWNSNDDLETLTYVIEPSAQHQPQQTPSPVPSQQEPQNQEMNAVVSALAQISQGLNASFNQFGSVLQSMQAQMQNMEQRYATFMQSKPFEDDGGRG